MENQTSSTDAVHKEPMSLVSRFMGVIFSPTAVFSEVVQRPHWLGMLLVVSIIGAVFIGSFLASEVGQEAWLDEALSRSTSASGEISDQQIEAFEKIQPYVGIFGAAQVLFGGPLVQLIISGILFVVFSTILGATATFRQLFAVVVHSGVIAAIQNIFTWPLNYFRETMSPSPTSLASFLPMLDEDGFAYGLAEAIDLFLVWWIIVLAIGLAILYKKKAKSIAISLFIVYGLIASVIAAVF
jgi:hypothetical protein